MIVFISISLCLTLSLCVGVFRCCLTLCPQPGARPCCSTGFYWREWQRSSNKIPLWSSSTSSVTTTWWRFTFGFSLSIHPNKCCCCFQFSSNQSWIYIITPVLPVCVCVCLQGSPKLLGRAFAEPEFKTVEKYYKKPRLRFFDINKGRARAGELLATFELIELDYSVFGEVTPSIPLASLNNPCVCLNMVDSPPAEYKPSKHPRQLSDLK